MHRWQQACNLISRGIVPFIARVCVEDGLDTAGFRFDGESSFRSFRVFGHVAGDIEAGEGGWVAVAAPLDGFQLVERLHQLAMEVCFVAADAIEHGRRWNHGEAGQGRTGTVDE